MNVTIEASIGVGKSTLLRNLKEILEQSEFSTSVFPEPTDSWEKTEKGNLLLMFSKNQGKYAMATQTHIMTTLNQQRANPPDTQLRIYERSLQSAKYVFQSGLAEQGFLNEMECLILDNLHEVLTKNMPITDRIIYLRADPDVAYQRAKSRNGSSDRLLSLDYFKLLHKKHEQMVDNLISSGKIIHVIEAHMSEADIAKKAAEWIKKEARAMKEMNKKERNNEMNETKLHSTGHKESKQNEDGGKVMINT